jgi:hypothetical protein
VGADRRSDYRAGLNFEMIVTVGLCTVAHFSECFLARGTVWPALDTLNSARVELQCLDVSAGWLDYEPQSVTEANEEIVLRS